MTNRDLVYIFHILEAVNKILAWTDEVRFEEFIEKDGLLQDAVIRQLSIAGEASQRVSEDIKKKYPEIPWYEIAGTRNRLIHEYAKIEVKIVWEIVKGDLPKFKLQLIQILYDLGGEKQKVDRLRDLTGCIYDPNSKDIVPELNEVLLRFLNRVTIHSCDT